MIQELKEDDEIECIERDKKQKSIDKIADIISSMTDIQQEYTSSLKRQHHKVVKELNEEIQNLRRICDEMKFELEEAYKENHKYDEEWENILLKYGNFSIIIF
jgi:uncharacterized protein YukE